MPLLTLPLAAAFFVGAFVRYAGAGHDDEFIFLWAGRTLATHPWFANANGDLQDMVSSPLTGLLAALANWMAPQASLVIFKLMGLLAAAMVLPLVAMAAQKALGDAIVPRQRLVLSLLAVLTVALAPTFAYWAAGGMETPFQALALVLFGLALAAQRSAPGPRNATALAAAACAVVLLRIEGPWVLAVALPVLCEGRARLKPHGSDLVALAVPLSLFVAVAYARFRITGAAWPNPVYAKGGELAELVPLGLSYLEGFVVATPLAGLLQLATLAAFLLAFLAAQRGFSMAPAERSLVLAFSGLAVGQDLFTIFAGGNWMGHYRFLAPTLPLKAVLLTWAVGRLCFYRPFARLLPLVLAGLVVAQLGQSGRNPNYADSLADPQPLWPLSAGAGLPELQRRILLASPPHARDERELRPFVAERLPALLHAERPLCIATYQAGYFPWMVRENLSAERVRIADTLGLNDRIAARRPGARNPFGVADGFAIDLLIEKRAPALETLCRGRPDLVYVLDAPSPMRVRMASLGYQLVWDRPGAVVFGRVPGHG